MLRFQGFLTLLCAVVLFTILGLPPVAPAGEKKDDGKVAGILIEKKETWLTVKADGEDEPVKYLVAKDADKNWSKR